MKEHTSRHQDLDRRLGAYFGLAGLVCNGMLVLSRGDDFDTALVNGALAMALCGLVGWALGAGLQSLIRAAAEAAAAEAKAKAAAEEARAEAELGTRVSLDDKAPLLVAGNEGDQNRGDALAGLAAALDRRPSGAA